MREPLFASEMDGMMWQRCLHTRARAALSLWKREGEGENATKMGHLAPFWPPCIGQEAKQPSSQFLGRPHTLPWGLTMSSCAIELGVSGPLSPLDHLGYQLSRAVPRPANLGQWSPDSLA